MTDEIVKQLAHKNGMNINFDVSNVLYQCSQGEPIYKIIRSTHLLDDELDEILKVVDSDDLLRQVKETISEAKKHIDQALDSSFADFDIDALTKPLLEALDDVNLGEMFTKVSSALNITSIKSELAGVNLTSVAEALSDAAADAAAAGETATATKLRDSADEFEKLGDQEVVKKEVFPLIDAVGVATDKLIENQDLGLWNLKM